MDRPGRVEECKTHVNLGFSRGELTHGIAHVLCTSFARKFRRYLFRDSHADGNWRAFPGVSNESLHVTLVRDFIIHPSIYLE